MFDLILIFLIVYLSYQNGQLAKQKGKNTVVYVLLTIVAILMTTVLGAIIILIGYRGALTEEALASYVQQRPLKVITMQFVSLGGYLIIRYILEQMPNKKKK